jgi:hypothetical protein
MATWDVGGADAPDTPLHCANHPNVETYLRCAKCEKPICARCRVSTPVGFRCFDCARLQVRPTYAVPADYYVKAALMSLGAAAISGIIMGFFPNFEFWAALLMGVVVPEAVAFASNQKRSPGLQMVAIVAIFVGFAISRVVMEVFDTVDVYRFFNPPPDLFRDLPVYVTQYTIMWFAVAAILAYRRLQ